MLYSEIIAAYSQIHTKHINTLCGQNIGLLRYTNLSHTTQFTSHAHYHYQLPLYNPTGSSSAESSAAVPDH